LIMGHFLRSAVLRWAWLLCSLSVVFFVGCGFGADSSKRLKTGMWRGTLTIQDQLLPFNFEIHQPQSKHYQVEIINGEERIPVEDVRVLGDSLVITMNIFDSFIKAKIRKNKLTGTWYKKYAPGYVIPFQATFGESSRFNPAAPSTGDFSGKWRVKFSKDTLDAVGLFEQKDSQILGTFLTSKGDYRYLQGVVSGDSLFLSTFDGAHAFLFQAQLNADNQIEGVFHSGPTWNETWTAQRDSTAELAHSDSLTYLNPGYDKLSFAFPDLNGKTVTLEDAKYKNKVVIVQIFGTWCPNCIDETRFLTSWYDHNRNLGIEIIGLAYERIDDFSYAKKRLNKMIDKLDIKYDFLIAGTSDKAQASQTLPMLNHIMSFPTTIFIDHKGVIRRIHTGFSGPGTGVYYQQFVDDFELFTNKLITERLSDTTLIATP